MLKTKLEFWRGYNAIRLSCVANLVGYCALNEEKLKEEMTRAIIAFGVFSLPSSSKTTRARGLFMERRRFPFYWITELRFRFSLFFYL